MLLLFLLLRGCPISLQGVGLNLDDALAFWRAEFTQKVRLFDHRKSFQKKKKSAAHQCSWAIIIFFCFSFNELKISNPPPHLSLPRDQVGSERFDKEYAYTIRHNYGKEGKRTVGTLFSDPPDE